MDDNTEAQSDTITIPLKTLSYWAQLDNFLVEWNGKLAFLRELTTMDLIAYHRVAPCQVQVHVQLLRLTGELGSIPPNSKPDEDKIEEVLRGYNLVFDTEHNEVLDLASLAVQGYAWKDGRVVVVGRELPCTLDKDGGRIKKGKKAKSGKKAKGGSSGEVKCAATTSSEAHAGDSKKNTAGDSNSIHNPENPGNKEVTVNNRISLQPRREIKVRQVDSQGPLTGDDLYGNAGHNLNLISGLRKLGRGISKLWQ